jgi:hypothetical protein
MARVELQRGLNGHPVLVVALSERNLLTLLSKLYTPGSLCEVWNGDVPSAFAFVRLRAEPDDVHYSSPTRLGAPPGPMHPVTEKVLLAIHAALADLGVEDIGSDLGAGDGPTSSGASDPADRDNGVDEESN